MSNDTEQKADLSFRDRLIDQHKKTLTNLDEFVKVMSVNIGTMFSTVVANLRRVINNQGMELILLREIEEGIRKQSLSSEAMKALLDEILELRQNMRAEAEAATAKAAAEVQAEK